MSDVSRRRFLGDGLEAGAVLALPWTAGARAAPGGMGGRLRKYLEPLPVPGRGIVVASPVGTNQYAFTQRQIRRRLHPPPAR